MSTVLLLQLPGALLVLGSFVALSLGRVDARDTSYLLANAIGAAILAVEAALHQQWGFLLLEVVWAAVSARSLASQPSRHERRAQPRGRASSRSNHRSH